jgi:hypothetical protein
MRRQSAAIVAGTAVVLLLVLSVSVSDRVWLVRGGSGTDEELPPGLREPEKGEQNANEAARIAHDGVGQWFTVLSSIVLLVIAVGLLLVVARQVRVSRRRRRERDGAVDRGLRFGEVTAEPLELPPALVETASRLDEVLATGTPRNAIVNCWVALEHGSASVGLPRHPAETSVEFTARVLGTFAMSDSAIDALAALYREARFSSHDMTEQHRAAAVEALHEVQSQLRAARSTGAATSSEAAR